MSKCGSNNNEGVKFCVNCGNNLEMSTTSIEPTVVSVVDVTDQSVEQVQEASTFVEPTITPVVESINQPVEQVQQAVQPIQQVPTVQANINSNQQSKMVDSSSFNFIKYIISFVLNPFETYKKEETKLSNTKNGLLLGGIVAGAMIINLLTAMISAIFVKAIDPITFEYKTKVDFAGLKDLDYLSLIGKNLLIYACIIATIAVVYYFASLVAKKNVNFIKTVSLSASSIIPYVIMNMIVSPVLGKIWFPLSIVATIVGAVYSIIIFLVIINEEIKFDKNDIKIYFHLVCLTILGVAAYYLFMNMFTNAITEGITDGLGDMLNMFN